LACTSCEAQFRLEEFLETMGDFLDEEVGNIRSDRF
jgi:hypothetical protein